MRVRPSSPDSCNSVYEFESKKELGSGTERQLLVVVARSSPQEMAAQTELLTSLANNIIYY